MARPKSDQSDGEVEVVRGVQRLNAPHHFGSIALHLGLEGHLSNQPVDVLPHLISRHRKYGGLVHHEATLNDHPAIDPLVKAE